MEEFMWCGRAGGLHGGRCSFERRAQSQRAKPATAWLTTFGWRAGLAYASGLTDLKVATHGRVWFLSGLKHLQLFTVEV